jgi:hypothetical protein
MRMLALLTCLALCLALASPAPADQAQGAGQGAQGTGQAAQTQGGSGTIGGIKPVSPEEFAGKLEALGQKVYQGASPLTDMVAVLALAAAAVLAFLVVVVGSAVLKRVLGAALAVVLGLLLWYCAPYLVALVKGLAALLQS